MIKCFSRGLRVARPVALVWPVALALAGCGTQTPGSATPSAAPASTPVAAIAAGPQLGLIWSASDATLRPLLGVPGATRLGAPLFAPGAYTYAAYAPVSQSALLLDPQGGLQLLALPSSEPSTVTRGIPSGALIAFSPQGRYAAVYTPGAASLTLVSGLPQQPVAANVTAPGAIRSVAVSDQGTLLLASGAAPGVLSVTLTPSSGTRSAVATLQGYGGMTFLPGSEDLLLADSLAGTVIRYHSGAATTLATPSSGLAHPLALAASLDAHWAVVASQGSGALLRLDLTGATPPASSTCNCSPVGLLPLTGNALFELAAPTASPGWMIEADDVTARVLFIPAARSGQ